MLRKYWKWIVFAVMLVLTIIYGLGPRPATPVYNLTMPVIQASGAQLDEWVAHKEAQHKLKPNNEARVVWYNDSLKNKTDYSIVYLHGFSASQEEGRPVHTNISKEFGFNLYLSRLSEHGLDTVDPLIRLTPESYWQSCKEALAIGKQIGKKVILMGTSTGGTNALQLAANYPDDVAALVLLSPNVSIFETSAFLLNNPWGLQIAEAITGNAYMISKDERPIYRQYWYWKYPLQAATELQEYLETTMTTETFEKVKQPTLLLYYYKDEVHQDSVVSIPAMLKMYDELGTPAAQKTKQALPNTANHVLASYIRSKDLLGVQTAIANFLEKQLQLPKHNNAIIKSTDDSVSLRINVN